MEKLKIEGLRRPMGRAILGMSAEPSAMAALYDRFVELSGDAGDSARWYHEEPWLGAWLAASGMRDDLVIISKVCHPVPLDGPPRVTPEGIASDLTGSLERLRVDRVDLLLLHRDDPAVPVGELIAALEEERVAGRIDAYGASNWTTARLDAARRWADAHGIRGFAAGSPNLSLAAPVVPPWPGCVTASSPESLAWYERTRLPLLAWSPLGRGYVTEDLAAIGPDVLAAFDSRSTGRGASGRASSHAGPG